jgi:hypothetical protein
MGWICTFDTYLPDEDTTVSAPVYYGYVPSLSRSVYSYDRSSMLEGGSRVTDGKIISANSITTDGRMEAVYYAPVKLVSSSSSIYDFAYSNENSSDAAFMGQGVIRSRGIVEMDESQPSGDIYYGIVASDVGLYRAYSKTDSPFIEGRFIEVGKGLIISQGPGALINVILESTRPDEKIWQGALSGNSIDAFHRVFRTESSFSGTPPDPELGGSHYYNEGGVTYIYSGKGRLYDASSFAADLGEPVSSIFSGITQNQTVPWFTFSTDPSVLDFSSFHGDGWTYGLFGEQQVLHAQASPSFKHPKDPESDPDQDGLSTYVEVLVHRTNPQARDTDQDLVPDAVEIDLGRDPLVYNDPSEDDDDDGVSNFEEYLNGTDPNNPDGDNDRVPDAIEIAIGSNPTNPSETPDNVDLSQQVEMKFTIGDWSGSQSERYRIEVCEVDPDNSELETLVYRLAATTHGEVVDGKSKRFRLDRTYRARIYWEGSSQDEPDYDWTMEISADIPMLRDDRENPGQWLTTPANESSAAEPPPGIGLIKDADQILGQHDQSKLDDENVFQHQGQAVEFELVRFGITGHLPGPNGASVSETDEDDPNNLVIIANDNFDERRRVDGVLQPDYNDNVLQIAKDHNYNRIKLRFPSQIKEGRLKLTSARGDLSEELPASLYFELYSDDGLTRIVTEDFEIDLANPTGQLSDIATLGEITLLIEAQDYLSETLPPLRLTWSYEDGPIELAPDELHFHLIDIDFEDTAGPGALDDDDEGFSMPHRWAMMVPLNGDENSFGSGDVRVKVSPSSLASKIQVDWSAGAAVPSSFGPHLLSSGSELLTIDGSGRALGAPLEFRWLPSAQLIDGLNVDFMPRRPKNSAEKVKVALWRIKDVGGLEPNITLPQHVILAFLEESWTHGANVYFEVIQDWGEPQTLFYDLNYDNVLSDQSNLQEYAQIVDGIRHPNADVNIYLVKDISGRVAAAAESFDAIFISEEIPHSSVVAQEVGHILGIPEGTTDGDDLEDKLNVMSDNPHINGSTQIRRIDWRNVEE